MANTRQALEDLMEINKELGYINSINKNLLYWDTMNNMPRKGMEYRKETIVYLSKEYFRISSDKRIDELIGVIESEDIRDKKISSMIRKIKRNKMFMDYIPEDEYIDYQTSLGEGELMWNEARRANDFDILIPYLNKIINHLRNFAGYFGYTENPYDGMLAYNSINMKYDQLKPIFQNIKNTTSEILNRVEERPLSVGKDIFIGRHDIKKQIIMTDDILSYIGFDRDGGRIDLGSYPTVLPISNKDVRIFTKYHEGDFRPGFTTAFHTGAQAVYEQGVDSSLYSYQLAEAASTTVQEVVARYYENIVGKSLAFWEFYYPKFKKLFPAYKDLPLKDFYNGLNRVESSHIRMDADELTYNLHVILRTELENELINDRIRLEDLKQVWNEKCRDYLHLETPNDRMGVLQDVHWVSGYYGYFTNYILGNIYAAQIDNVIGEKLANKNDLIAKGNFIELNEWFYTNIYSQGAIYNTEELMLNATDEVLNHKYYNDYLINKYSSIYE